MINAALQKNFSKNIAFFYTHSRPMPKPLSYSMHDILTPPSLSTESYHHITPYIRYKTYKSNFSYSLQIETPKNKIQINDFSSEIQDIIIFTPKNIFSDFKPCLLIVLENQLIIYSIEMKDFRMTLYGTGLSCVVLNKIVSYSVNSVGDIIFCTEYDAYVFYYNSGILCRTYAYNLKGIVKQIAGVFFKPKRDYVDVCISDSYAVVLRVGYFELYRVINGNLKYVNKQDVSDGVKVQIYDDKYIFVVKKSGERVFYNEYGFLYALPLKEESEYYNGETIVESDGNTTVIVQKRVEQTISDVQQDDYYRKLQENENEESRLRDTHNTSLYNSSRSPNLYTSARSQDLCSNSRSQDTYNANSHTNLGSHESYDHRRGRFFNTRTYAGNDNTSGSPCITSILVTVITQNEYALDNPNAPRENLCTFTLQEDIQSVKIFNNEIFMQKKNGFYSFTCINLCDFILKCKQEEMHKLVNHYKEENFLIKYLELIEREEDVSRIDFMFLKTKDYDFVYKYIVKTLIDEKIIQKGQFIETEQSLKNHSFTTKYYNNCFFYTKDFFDNFYAKYNSRVQRCIKKFICVQEKMSRYRKEGFKVLMSDLKNVIDTLKFIKIVNDRGIKIECKFESLLFSMNYRRNILSQLSQIMSFEKTSEMIRNTLKGYFPIEEVHFRKGLELIKIKKRDNFYESIKEFKKGKDFEEIIKLYNDDKFYTGSVTIIRDCMYEAMRSKQAFGTGSSTRYNDGYKRLKVDNERYKSANEDNGTSSCYNAYGTFSDYGYYADLLSKCILCQGALSKALEDPRKDFIFVVLESYLQNLLNNIKFSSNCLCCNKSVKYKVNNLPIDIIYLENNKNVMLNSIINEFLESKYKISQNKIEYNLLWKFYVENDEFEKAREICIESAKNKSLTLNERKEYLEYGYCIDRNDDVKLMKQILNIQIELTQTLEDDLKEEKFNMDSLKLNFQDLNYLKSKMLSVNELFNVYLYPYNEFLALKVLKIMEFDDFELKKELFERMFNYDYLKIIEKLSFIKEINNNDWVNIEIIGNILINKIINKSPINLVDILKNFYYSEEKIKRFLEKRLKSKDLHFEIKRRVLLELKTYFGDVSELEKVCYERFGIKC